ncbi:hypothetical protein QQP08_000528 [Theobroma cacao]|uniref:Uncharacterized protein n=1 Tax=Theobroma cacao TaxID=3641 RepID=A0A061DHZ7_THECC|nr:Uncharacterized protein TCM_000908 [Theobroma cacao]WRX08041.1 hypothetical protein QQP08_000528 [Theobroma cacao]
MNGPFAKDSKFQFTLSPYSEVFGRVGIKFQISINAVQQMRFVRDLILTAKSVILCPTFGGSIKG